MPYYRPDLAIHPAIIKLQQLLLFKPDAVSPPSGADRNLIMSSWLDSTIRRPCGVRSSRGDDDGCCAPHAVAGGDSGGQLRLQRIETLRNEVLIAATMRQVERRRSAILGATQT